MVIATMKIGELAETTGVRVETIRYYEAQKLLQAPKRMANNYREYSREHVERLLFIQRCRSLDLTQDEVRTLIKLQEAPSAPCDGGNELLDAHLVQLGARISQLKALRREIEDIRNAYSGTACIEDCRALDSLGNAPGKRRARAAGSIAR